MASMIIDHLARDYRQEGKLAEAEEFLKETLAAQEKAYGESSPRLLMILRQYASLLRETGRSDEADQLEQRAQQISAQLRTQRQPSTNVPPAPAPVPFRREE